MNSITVIIPIYKGTNPTAFVNAVDSILKQTMKPESLIIAIDGPIGSDVQIELDKYEKDPIVKLVRSEKNIGLGRILKYTQNYVDTELIARMDSDDVSVLNRLEVQYKYFVDNNLDILGTYISEASSEGEKFLRKVPLDKEGILKRVQYRSPFNHVTILMKKSVLTDMENYEDCLYAEDWYLWLRLLKNHPEIKVANLPEALVEVNTDDYKRLSGARRFKIDVKYLNKFYKEGLMGTRPYLVNLSSVFVVRIILGKKAKWFYTKLLRTKSAA